ncbi:MAG TPA: hypothetical protein VF820_07385 [Patescibacteria group bacterium]
MICSKCHIGKSVIHPQFGILPCTSCQKAQGRLRSPKSPVEFTSESIKEQRKAYRKDFLPMHNRGELDKGWVDRFGTKKAKEHGFSDREIKKAKYVWSGSDEYYKSE